MGYRPYLLSRLLSDFSLSRACRSLPFFHDRDKSVALHVFYQCGNSLLKHPPICVQVYLPAMDPTKDEQHIAAVDDAEFGQTEETARVLDHVAERRLCRKFDVRLMPVLAIMCR